jgi:hypothetical protein
MFKSLMIAVTLSTLALATGACAGQLPSDAQVAQQDHVRVVTDAAGQTRHVYSNPLNCEPERAIPVWGQPAGAEPLGYRCRPSSANGG